MSIPPEIHELLAGFVMGDLSPEELAEVNETLQAQPELQAELDRLQFTLSLLPLALPETSPPLSLKASILKGLEQPAPLPAPLPAPRQKADNSLHWLWGMGALLSVLTTGWAFDSYHLRQRLATMATQTTTVATDQNVQMILLRGMAQKDTAYGVITLEPKRGMAIVQIRDLQPTTGNLTYRLWVIDSNGQKIDCGELRPDASGRVSKEMPLALTALKGATITLEPIEGAPQPTRKTVMRSDA